MPSARTRPARSDRARRPRAAPRRAAPCAWAPAAKDASRSAERRARPAADRERVREPARARPAESRSSDRTAGSHSARALPAVSATQTIADGGVDRQPPPRSSSSAWAAAGASGPTSSQRADGRRPCRHSARPPRVRSMATGSSPSRTCREAQRVGGRRVRPLHVVDQAEDRSLGSQLRHEPERRKQRQEALTLPALGHPERPAQRGGVQVGQTIEELQAEAGGPGAGRRSRAAARRVGTSARSTANPAAPCTRLLHEGRLAGTRLAAEHEGSARARSPASARRAQRSASRCSLARRARPRDDRYVAGLAGNGRARRLCPPRAGADPNVPSARQRNQIPRRIACTPSRPSPLQLMRFPRGIPTRTTPSTPAWPVHRDTGSGGPPPVVFFKLDHDARLPTHTDGAEEFLIVLTNQSDRSDRATNVDRVTTDGIQVVAAGAPHGVRSTSVRARHTSPQCTGATGSCQHSTVRSTGAGAG